MSDLVWFLEKSTLNPDLLYNRLLYKRFLLYLFAMFFNVFHTQQAERVFLPTRYSGRWLIGQHVWNNQKTAKQNSPFFCTSLQMSDALCRKSIWQPTVTLFS